MNPEASTAARLQIQQTKVIRVLSGRPSQLLSYMSHRKGRERQAKGVVGLLIINYVPIATNVSTGREPGGECRRDLAVGKPIWAQPTDIRHPTITASGQDANFHCCRVCNRSTVVDDGKHSAFPT